MKKVLLTCGAGASSGFMAQKMRQAAKKKGLEYEIKAVSESELNDYMANYQILLIGPHLKYKLDALTEEAAKYNLPVKVIDEDIYGTLNGEALLEQVDEILPGHGEKQAPAAPTSTKVEKQEVKAAPTEQTNTNEHSNFVMDWVQNKLVPNMNRVTGNGFVKAIQDSMMLILPFIMVGSLISIFGIIRENFPAFPDLAVINTFSFGLFSLFLSFLLPYKVMENYEITKYKFYAALSGVATFLMLTLPVNVDEGMAFSADKLGAGGMLVALFTGIVVAAVFKAFAKFSFFKKDTSMPDIVVSWTDALVPVFLLLLGATILYSTQIDIYTLISDLFAPVFNIAQSLPGLIICSLVVTVMYAFGISSWAVFPVIWAIWMQGITDNISLAEAGTAATNLNLMEVFHPFIYLGGTGATLMLVIFMLRSKSKRLKLMGRLTIVPSIFNINEPVVFGTPIAFNPLLMIPMILCSIVLPIITYVFFQIGFVQIPTEAFQVWYLPIGLYGVLATHDIRSLVLSIVNLAVSGAIYWPFFRAYEKIEVEKEAKGEV